MNVIFKLRISNFNVRHDLKAWGFTKVFCCCHVDVTGSHLDDIISEFHACIMLGLSEVTYVKFSRWTVQNLTLSGRKRFVSQW